MQVLMLYALDGETSAVLGGFRHIAGIVSVHVGTEDDHIIAAVGKVHRKVPIVASQPRRGHGVVIESAAGEIAPVAAAAGIEWFAQAVAQFSGVNGGLVHRDPIFFFRNGTYTEVIPRDGCVGVRCGKSSQREGG